MCFCLGQERVNTLHVWGSAKSRLERNSRENNRVSELDWASSQFKGFTHSKGSHGWPTLCKVWGASACGLSQTLLLKGPQVTPGRKNQPSDCSFVHPASRCFPTCYDSETSWGFRQPELLLTASTACLATAEEVEAVHTVHSSVM